MAVCCVSVQQVAIGLGVLNVAVSMVLYIWFGILFGRAERPIGTPIDVAFCIYVNTKLARRPYQVYRILNFIVFFALGPRGPALGS